jgi:hypothetical protein
MKNWNITAKEKNNPAARPMKLRMNDGPKTEGAAKKLFSDANPGLELVSIEADQPAAVAPAPTGN